jgi:hypothetical protein
VLLWQRLHPSSVDPTVFTATRSEVQALYAFDYHDANGSIQRKLDALTGSLRDEYKKDLSQGGIIDTYQQVSATTSFDVVDVGLVQVNDSQDAATVVVFGQYKVTSVNSGTQAAPQGSECTTTTDGAQSCTQTVQLNEDPSRGPLQHVTASGVGPVGVAVSLDGPHWHHGRARSGSPARRRPHAADVSLVASSPPAWTGRVSRGRVSCCAAP